MGTNSFTTYITVPRQAKSARWLTFHTLGSAMAPTDCCVWIVMMPTATDTMKNGAFSSSVRALNGRRRNQSMARSESGNTTAAGFEAADRTYASRVAMSHETRLVSR